MSTLQNRPNTAVLVIDVQNSVVARAHERDTVVANIAGLVERARGSGTPVIWIQDDAENHPLGSDKWQIVPELLPTDVEARLDKRYGDAFEQTSLEEVLAGLGVGRLVVSGAQSDQCVRSTLHGAITRGYDTILVSDAHTTEDLTRFGAPPPQHVIAHTNLYWTYHEAPGRVAGTATAAEVDLGAP